jgi:poly(3-hydroxybutyrate) depolymerase
MILDACQPTKAVSVIEIHGTADGEVPYQGGHTAGGGHTWFSFRTLR